MSKIELNFHAYPLVVGQVDKFMFENWQEEGGHILLEAKVTPEDDEESGNAGSAGCGTKMPDGRKADGHRKAAHIMWRSSAPEVAKVEDGLVTALTTGIADITASLPDGSSDTCRIQVIDNIGRQTALFLRMNADHLVLAPKEGAALYPQMFPVDYFGEGHLDTTCEWSSSDEAVVRVNHRGRVLAVGEGRAVVTARSMDYGREATCQITVVKKPEAVLYAEPREDFDGGRVEMQARAKKRLTLPPEGYGEAVCWCSGNPSVASVDAYGVVHTYRAGNVKIWATFVNGGWRVCYDICVTKAKPLTVQKLCLSKKKLSLKCGEERPVYAVVFPATLLNERFNWESSDENVVQIVGQRLNVSGLDEVLVKGVQEGTATLTARATRSECGGSSQIREKAGAGRMRGNEDQEAAQAVCEVTVLAQDTEKLRTFGAEGVNTANAVASKAVLEEFADTDKDSFAAAYVPGERGVMSRVSTAHAAVKGANWATGDEDGANPYLSNLHIPAETVTNHSVCLLWNRRSLLDAEALSHYEIYQDGEKIADTKKISYTVKGLLPETAYTFEVAAVRKAAGKNIAAAESATASEAYEKAVLRAENDAVRKRTAPEPEILHRMTVQIVTKPAPAAVLDVTKAPYLAVGDGIASDTCVLQQAIDDCPAGGEVLLPKGYVFLSGALFLKSNMTLRVDGILFGTEDPDEYPPVVCRWEGYRKLTLTEEWNERIYPVFPENNYSHASLINIGVYDEGSPGEPSPYHTKNVRICGEGMINGNGFTLSYNEGPCHYTARKGLPIPPSPMRDQNIRGRLIALYNTQGAYISDVTIGYSPSWTVQATFSDALTFDNVKVISMGDGRTGTTEGMLTLNGDGIDPDSSTNINIVNCYFTTGDDAVAIKSGRNRQGWQLARPSAYIRVTDCVCRDAKGSFAIGSESAGDVHDVLFQNLYVENLTNFGLWIKSAPCRGGEVHDVIMRDCVLKDTGGAVQIEYNHGGDEDAAPELPRTRHVTIENIHFAGKHKFAVRVMGVPDSPIHDVAMRGFTYASDFYAKRDRKFCIENCRNVKLPKEPLPNGYQWETDNTSVRIGGRTGR